jgi:phosphoadenosine phosphosulfate reductase
MRYILRRREIVADDWVHLGEEPEGAAALIVPLGQLRADAARWAGWRGRLGVRLTPGDAPEDLAAELASLALVAVEFPNAGDGRGYSQGRLLRNRLGFQGELRAVGAGVKRDQVFLLARCGFDAIELAPGEDLEAARRALTRYTVAYQPGAAGIALERQRFTPGQQAGA